MGQKTNPILFRLYRQGQKCQPQSQWMEIAKYAENVGIDKKIRDHFEKDPRFKQAGISQVIIDSANGMRRVTVFCARPGIIIGRKGADIDSLRSAISILVQEPVQLTVKEIKKVELDAKLVAENVASQLERRVQYRKAMKRAIQSTMRAGAQGVRVVVSGRLGGAEIARDEKYTEGRLPLSTIRSDIGYYHAIAKTTYGIIGVKVWIYRGDVFLKKEDK